MQGAASAAVFLDLDLDPDTDRNSESGGDTADDTLLGDTGGHPPGPVGSDDSERSTPIGDGDRDELTDDDSSSGDDERATSRSQSRSRSRRRRQFTLPIEQRSAVLQAELKHWRRS